MKRKIISTFLVISGLFFIGFSALLFMGVFSKQESGILIESDPVSTVYINGQMVGQTPYEAKMPPQEISIRIKPEKVGDIEFDDYETKVELVSGIRTIVKRVFNESEDLTSGVVVSFEKAAKEDSIVTVVSVPDNSEVFVDGKLYGYTPLRVNIPAGDHNLVVSSQEYLEKSLPIKVFKGYKLTASVKLAKSIEVAEINNDSEVLAVSDEEPLFRVKINNTDTGFLRVRSGANIGFPEIAQVKPDEEYDVFEEGENGSWYKIKIQQTTDDSQQSETEGWVSSEFVTKI